MPAGYLGCHTDYETISSLQGGSWISTGDEASRFARFAFRRHFLQHAGFRIARSVTDSDESVPLPVRLVNTEVYVLGSGVEGDFLLFTNKHYHWPQ